MFSLAASSKLCLFIDLLPDQNAIALYNLQNCKKKPRKAVQLIWINEFAYNFQVSHHPVCFHLWTNRAGEKIMSR